MHFMNDKGENRLHKWLAAHVRGFEMHDYSAWIDQAEDVAANTQAGDDFIIEITRHESTTGRPETLTMPKNWFSK